MAGPHTAGCLAPHFLRQWSTSAIPAPTPVMSELPPHRCGSINNHWHAKLTMLDEAPTFFFLFFKFSFSLLWKVIKLYRYLFYLIHSHILIHQVVKKMILHMLLLIQFDYCATKLYTFPQSHLFHERRAVWLFLTSFCRLLLYHSQWRWQAERTGYRTWISCIEKENWIRLAVLTGSTSDSP